MFSARTLTSSTSPKAIALTLAFLGLAASASAAFAGAAMTSGGTKLYDGPIAGAALIDTVPAGAKVGVLWCGMANKWCLVDFHAKQGFVDFSGLTFIKGALAPDIGFTSSGNNPGQPTHHVSGPVTMH